MNLNDALNIFELNSKYNINNIFDLTNTELKKTYHILALNYHPDKNKHVNANEQFQKIQTAYLYLYKYINSQKDYPSEYFNNYPDDINNDTAYNDIIINFLNLIIKNFASDELLSEEQEYINVKKFKTECIEYSYKIIEKLLDNLNINVLEEIYTLVNNFNKDSLIIPEKTLNIIINAIKKKLESYNIYIINPTLTNILNSEIYKLEIDDDIIYIPLWHNELNYENNIIKIVPILDNNFITIDDDNNIHYTYNDTYENIIKLLRENKLNKPHLEITINDIFSFKIPINELRFIENQTYVIKNIGIPIINVTDIFDNDKKGLIIVHILLK